MIIGVLQADIRVDHATSLKDKRRVTKSLRDRLHREHMVSVAEVGRLETLNVARLGIVMAGSDAKVIRSTLDRIVDKLEHGRDSYLDGHDIQIITPGE